MGTHFSYKIRYEGAQSQSNHPNTAFNLLQTVLHAFMSSLLIFLSLEFQATLFLALDTLLVAVMWKIYLHPRYVLQRGNYHQFIFMGMHYIFAYYIGFIPYMISVWLASAYIFGNFALSHTHLAVTNRPLHWVEYALLHTMDVEPSWMCNWWMSYLNFQV